MAQLSRLTSGGISKGGIAKGVLGAIALSLTFGAVASGRDLGQRDASAQTASTQIASTEATASVNRTAKADRAPRAAGPAAQTQTVALRLNGLADTSVLIRMPVAQLARSGTPASPLIKSGTGNTTLACDPVVSVLTEVAKRLQPGSCVT